MTIYNNKKIDKTFQEKLLPLTIFAVISVGVCLSLWSARLEDIRMRKELAVKASLVKGTIDVERISNLSGSESDLGMPDYKRLKSQLTQARMADPQSHFVYLEGMKADGKIFFYADSEKEGSSGYSPPGQIYSEVSNADRSAFYSDKVIVNGPESDRWGTWISALVPIVDPNTGKVYAVCGMDVEARNWYTSILYRSLFPVTLSLCASIMIAFLLYIRRLDRKANESLEYKSMLLEANLQTSINGILAIDGDGHIIFYNERFSSLFNIPEGILKTSDALIMFKAASSRLKDPAEFLSREKYLYEHKDEKLRDELVFVDDRHIERYSSPLIDSKGRYCGRIWYFFDVTDTRKAEGRLRDALSRVRTIMDSVQAGIMLVRKADRVIVDINQAAADMVGLKVDDLIGKVCNEHICPADAGKCPVYDLGQAVDNSERCVRRLDGVTIPVLKTATPVTVYGQEHMLESFVDISARKKAEEDLRESEERYRALYMESQDAIMTLLPGNVFLSGNPAAIKMFGCADEKEFTSKSPATLSPELQPDGSLSSEKAQRMMALAIEKGSNFFEWTHRRVDGTEFPATVLLSRIVKGGKPYLQATVRDITEAKLAERAIKETAETKSKFTSMVSHELRNPLGAIREGINLVLDGSAGSINEQQRSFLILAKNNIDRLGRLINNVLDFQKIEWKTMQFDMKPNNINETIMDAAKIMSILADKKGLNMTANLDSDIPLIIFDRDKISQVVTNIVSNAVKFTEEGDILISTKKEDNVVHVVVQDTGPGIKAEEKEKLFQPFEQLDIPRDKRKVGTGLGLAISKEIILAHNGKIWVESEPGRGASFHFVLPIRERRA